MQSSYERKILKGVADESERNLLKRKILELCRHVEALDIRDEHKEDLNDFRRRWLEEKEVPSSRAGESSDSGQNVGESGTEEAKKQKNGK